MAITHSNKKATSKIFPSPHKNKADSLVGKSLSVKSTGKSGAKNKPFGTVIEKVNNASLSQGLDSMDAELDTADEDEDCKALILAREKAVLKKRAKIERLQEAKRAKYDSASKECKKLKKLKKAKAEKNGDNEPQSIEEMSKEYLSNLALQKMNDYKKCSITSEDIEKLNSKRSEDSKNKLKLSKVSFEDEEDIDENLDVDSDIDIKNPDVESSDKDTSDSDDANTEDLVLKGADSESGSLESYSEPDESGDDWEKTLLESSSDEESDDEKENKKENKKENIPKKYEDLDLADLHKFMVKKEPQTLDSLFKDTQPIASLILNKKKSKTREKNPGLVMPKANDLGERQRRKTATLGVIKLFNSLKEVTEKEHCPLPQAQNTMHTKSSNILKSLIRPKPLLE